MGTVAISSLPVGSAPDPNADQLLFVQGAVTHKLGVGQVGTLLAQVRYTPAANYTTSSGTFVDMDATNLKVTFAAPPSGTVLVQLAAWGSDVSGTSMRYNLRDSGGDVANTAMYATPASGNAFAHSPQIIVSGLTPGTSYTWKWGYRAVGGTATVYNSAFLSMLVWSLPG